MSLDHVRATPVPGAGSADTNGENGGDAAGPRRPRRRRRRRGALVGVAVLAVLVTAVVVAGGDGGEGTGAEGATSTTTVAVEVRDLVLSDEFDGELGFGDTDPVTAGRAGVVTGVTPLGTTVGQGGVLFHLDLQPTVLLHGAVPAFRDLSVDADPGTDVTQLEQALVELGFGAGVTVDTEYTAATAAAVTDWEESLGRSDPDGVVTLGDMVFAPADLRIAEVTTEPGTQVQSDVDVMQVTATAKVVTLQLTVTEAGNLEAGTPVTIALPDDTEATGTITDVATEPSTTGTGSSTEGTGSSGDGGEGEGGGAAGSGEESGETYPVTIALDDPTAADSFDSGTVEVTVERSRVDDATALPVTALLALSEGGYALQVVDDSEPDGHRLVHVEVGAIADEWVEVTGDGIEAGVAVVVPE
jgi:HlyD family secretion protein/Putative peptidoglycan binding domain